MAINTHQPIITLNVNRLNAPIKTGRVVEWITKKRTYIHVPYDKLTPNLKTHGLKVEEWKKIFHTNRTE